MEQWVVGEKAGIARTADFVLDKTTESAGIATGLGQYQVRQSLSTSHQVSVHVSAGWCHSERRPQAGVEESRSSRQRGPLPTRSRFLDSLRSLGMTQLRSE